MRSEYQLEHVHGRCQSAVRFNGHGHVIPSIIQVHSFVIHLILAVVLSFLGFNKYITAKLTMKELEVKAFSSIKVIMRALLGHDSVCYHQDKVRFASLG